PSLHAALPIYGPHQARRARALLVHRADRLQRRPLRRLLRRGDRWDDRRGRHDLLLLHRPRRRRHRRGGGEGPAAGAPTGDRRCADHRHHRLRAGGVRRGRGQGDRVVLHRAGAGGGPVPDPQRRHGDDPVGHDPRRRGGDLDLLGHPGHPLRTDPDPLRHRPRRAHLPQVHQGQPPHPDPDLHHGRRLGRHRPHRGLRARRLPVGHRLHRHPGGLLHRRRRVMVLRRTHPDLDRPFRVPGYPVTPVLTILVCVWIVIKLPALTWMIFIVWLGVVLGFYLLYGRRHAALNHVTDLEEIAEPRGDEENERV